MLLVLHRECCLMSVVLSSVSWVLCGIWCFVGTVMLVLCKYYVVGIIWDRCVRVALCRKCCVGDMLRLFCGAGVTSCVLLYAGRVF